MLRKLIMLLQEGRLHSTSELASEMGVSEEMMKLLIGELEKNNYLQSNGEKCQTQLSSCDQCPSNQHCQLPIKKWALTAKSERLSISR